MKETEFQNKFLDKKIPTFVRNIADRVMDELRSGNFEKVSVTEDEFNMLCRYSGYKPIKPRLGTLFIRVFDEYDNGKDIQIFNPWKH